MWFLLYLVAHDCQSALFDVYFIERQCQTLLQHIEFTGRSGVDVAINLYVRNEIELATCTL